MENFDFVNYRIEGWDELNGKMHVHNNSYEILQIISGSGYFVIGGMPYRIIPGAVYFMNSVQLHGSRPDDSVEYIRSKISVNASYFDGVLRLLQLEDIAKPFFDFGGGSCVSLPSELVNEVDKAFKRMSEAFNADSPDANARITMLLVGLILNCATIRSTNSVARPSDSSLISRTINYIDANISGELTIESISKENFVSKYHLCRVFKKTLGVSIMKYILSRRIMLAKEQLINTDITCSDIAMLMGFSSFSYFCRAFKEQEGITPSRYRKLYGKSDKQQS